MNKISLKRRGGCFQFQKQLLLAAVMLLCVSGIVFPACKAYAAKDTKKPSVTLKSNTDEPTNQSVKITVTAKDASGIKVVKWAKGKQSSSYFKSDGTKLSLKSGKATVKATKNGTYTFYAKDKAGNVKIKTIEITNIDKVAPKASASYAVMNQKATVTIKAKDSESGIASVLYLSGKVTDASSDKWKQKGKDVSDTKKFTVKKAGNYSIRVTDKAGNHTVSNLSVTLEMRAVWISYLEFITSRNYGEAEFKSYIDKIFDNCVGYGLNTVIVQVRPFSDAMYQSKYFPWSYYASGTMGKSPGYDPLEYMVSSAHKKGLSIHAWINPYRVTSSGTDVSALPESHPARKWRENAKTKRNVLSYGGALYYNPASEEAQSLIINGIKEIVKNYDVDGIHFDDYFYPNLGADYKSNFDAAEYKEYAKECKEEGKEAEDIVTWRRNQVNRLVRKAYSAIKSIDSDCVFGISPQGNIDNLLSSQKYYVDIEKWLSSSSYVDYICPQIYWGLHHKTAPFGKKLQQFLDIRTSKTVNVYAGLAVYKCGASFPEDTDWKQSNSVIADEVKLGRETGLVDGFMLYRYESLLSKKKEMANLMEILNE